jgi:aminodeoxyfutalosine synthase
MHNDSLVTACEIVHKQSPSFVEVSPMVTVEAPAPETTEVPRRTLPVVHEPGPMPSFLENRITRGGLGDILDAVYQGNRLTPQQGLRLYEHRDLQAVGALANFVRERHNGQIAWFNRNLHMNYTNICNKQCLFCAFDRLPGEEGGYVVDREEAMRRFTKFDAYKPTEVHMVGGVNPRLPFQYYLDLLRDVKDIRPDIHIKAFTMVEMAQLFKISKMSPEETIAALREAGLGSCPGGGCEVLSDRVHKEIFRLKLRPQQWLDMQRMIHRSGLKSNATMLYGHIETYEERVGHFVKLRELQDETGGFNTFIPLAFHPRNTELSHLPETTGFEDLKNIAVARLMLDNFPHIKAFWIMISTQMAQVSLWYGGDDMDGTVLDERIVHEAGASTPIGVTLQELVKLIKEAGRIPVERDTVYNELSRDF